MKNKILITGISGFLGYELAERCLEKGYDVAGFIRQHPQHNDAIEKLKGRVSFYIGDLLDESSLVSAIHDFQPDFCWHGGALTRVADSFEIPKIYTRTNYDGTINIIEALKKEMGPALKKFIFCSSMEVFGRQPELFKRFEPFTEKTIPNPSSPYASAKIGAEAYVGVAYKSWQFPGVSLRQTNCYGRRFDDFFVVERIIKSMITNEKEANFGESTYRNFIYKEDLIDLYINLLESNSEEILGKFFTIGPPNAISIEKLAHMIAEKLDWHGKINWRTRPKILGEISYLNSSNDYIKEMTGWKPKVSLSEGLDKVIDYWRKK